jgi:hypothetical protein
MRMSTSATSMRQPVIRQGERLDRWPPRRPASVGHFRGDVGQQGLQAGARRRLVVDDQHPQRIGVHAGFPLR